MNLPLSIVKPETGNPHIDECWVDIIDSKGVEIFTAYPCFAEPIVEACNNYENIKEWHDIGHKTADDFIDIGRMSDTHIVDKICIIGWERDKLRKENKILQAENDTKNQCIDNLKEQLKAIEVENKELKQTSMNRQKPLVEQNHSLCAQLNELEAENEELKNKAMNKEIGHSLTVESACKVIEELKQQNKELVELIKLCDKEKDELRMQLADAYKEIKKAKGE